MPPHNETSLNTEEFCSVRFRTEAMAHTQRRRRRKRKLPVLYPRALSSVLNLCHTLFRLFIYLYFKALLLAETIHHRKVKQQMKEELEWMSKRIGCSSIHSITPALGWEEQVHFTKTLSEKGRDFKWTSPKFKFETSKIKSKFFRSFFFRTQTKHLPIRVRNQAEHLFPCVRTLTEHLYLCDRNQNICP
jgi:hypothetical protein